MTQTTDDKSTSPVIIAKLKQMKANEIAPFISLAVLVAFFSIVVEDFLSFNTVTSVLTQGSVLAIAAVGMTFVLLCAEIDLSIGMVALLSACVCGELYERWSAGLPPETELRGISLVMCMIAPLLMAGILGLASGFFTVSARLPSFIITLAMMNIADGLARYITESQLHKVPPALNSLGNDAFSIGEMTGNESFNDLFIPYSALLAAVVMIVGWLMLQYTRFGRYIYMTGGNREAARLAGIRTGLIVTSCLAICAFTAGLAGLLNGGRLNGVTVDQNKDLLLNAVACVVLGGTSLFGGEGSMGRTLVGVVTFTVLSVGLTNVEVPQMENFDLLRPFLMGIVLLAALLINGYLAKRSKTT